MQKQQILINPTISMTDKESLKFLLGIEEFCDQNQLVKGLISHHFVHEDKPNPVMESNLDLDFETIDPKDFSKSVLKSAVWHIVPIEDFFPGDVILDAEALIKSGLLDSWREAIFEQFPISKSLNVEQFDEYIEQNGIRDTLNSLYEEELKLTFPMDVAFMKILANNPVHMDEITKFIKSEYFTEECSSLVSQKEYYIISDLDSLRELFSYPLSLDAEWLLIKRFKSANPGFPKIYSAEEMTQVVESAESYEKYKEELFTKKLIFSNENLTPTKYLDLEFTQVSIEDALISFMENREVSDKEITSYIFRTNASPKINQIIVNKSDYLITDPVLYLKVDQAPVLTDDTRKVISDRYEGWFSKDKQKQFAIEFQSYDAGVIPLPGTSAEISSLVEKSKVLYSLVKNIAPEVTKGIVTNLPYVDGEYDAEGFPLVAEYKINRVLMTALRNQKAPADFVMYIHNAPQIEEDFKTKEIIAHPSCPNSLIDAYIEQHNMYTFLLKNPALTQEQLKKMVDNLKDIGAESEIYNAILNHPNCPSELKYILQEGLVGYFNKLKDSEDPNWLAEQTRLILNYPNNWKLPRVKLAIKDKNESLGLIIKNINTPTYSIEQLAAHYVDIETSKHEASAARRQLFLKRRDCPQSFVRKMIVDGDSSIRIEAINSNHFNDEDLIETALTYAFNAHMEALGDLNSASSKLLNTELSLELKEIIKNSPFPEQTRTELKKRILDQLNEDINKKDAVLNKNIVKFFKSNELIAGVIVLLEAEKNRIFDSMKQVYGAV